MSRAADAEREMGMALIDALFETLRALAHLPPCEAVSAAVEAAHSAADAEFFTEFDHRQPRPAIVLPPFPSRCTVLRIED